MELAESIITSLGDNCDQIPIDRFRYLINLAVNSLTVSSNHQKDISSDHISLSEKELLAALMTVIVESVSKRVSPVSVVIGLPISEIQAEIITTALTEHGPSLRRCLHLIGPAKPHLVDVDWKINYMIKSSNLERDADALILLQFHSESPNGLTNDSPQQLVCTPNELHDLVTKLREAVRNLERIADS